MSIKNLYKILFIIHLGFIAGTITHAQSFPVVAGTSTSLSGNPVTSHSVSLPAGIQLNDLLLIFWADAGVSSDITVPSGWIELYNDVSNNHRRAAYYKIANGNEGTSVTFTTSAQERSAHNSYRIAASTYTGTPEFGDLITNTNGSNANPPPLAPTWGAIPTLWITPLHMDGLGNNTLTGPLNYDNFLNIFTRNGSPGVGSDDATMASARRFLEAASEDPGQFTHGNRNYLTTTIAIQGAVGVPVGPVLRLMPLGDSITRGATGASANIGGAGYRYPLISSLKNLGYTFTVDGGNDFDFVGSNVTGDTSVVGRFDRDSQGVSGMMARDDNNTSRSLVHLLNSNLTQNPTDVILLLIGTNDIGSGSTAIDDTEKLVSEVDSLLHIIYSFDSEIVVVISKIINRLWTEALIDSTNKFNDALQTMVEQRINDGDNLHLVDVGFFFNYVLDPNPPLPYVGDMQDTLHPNDSGHVKISRVWYDELKDLLTPTLAFPLNASTDLDTNATFIWYPALGANSYHLQVSTQPDFSTSFYENDILTDTSALVSLEPSSNYYWRVRARINTGLSPWSEVWELTSALPVELSAFNVRLNGNAAELYWRTETEVNNYGFDIERKSADNDFRKIGFVQGNGNSNSPKEYSFTDKNLFGSNKFVYRLKQIDVDGTFAYSDEAEITLMPDKFELSQNYPNPFNPSTGIEFSLPYSSNVKIDIFDILGQHIQTLVNEELEEGYHKVIFDASGLPSGTYIYRMITDNFSQAKKMILIK
jgi:lysophospholipase L1-like esterase